MAGAAAEAGAAEEAAVLKALTPLARANHVIAMIASRDAPMRATALPRHAICRLNYRRQRFSRRACAAFANNLSADEQVRTAEPSICRPRRLCPTTLADELSRIPTEVIDIADAPPLAPPAPLTPSEVRTILISLMLTMFLAALDQTIVATALPTIGRQFHDVSNLSWVITAYLLASTAVAPVFGTLSDIYGRRAMIIISLSLFIAGSVLCAVAPNMPMLILARGLQGLGGGGIMPVVQTVISDVVTPARARPVPGLFQRRLGGGGILRPGPRRRVRRASALVDDLLDQSAARGSPRWRCCCRRWARSRCSTASARSTGSAACC